MTNETVAVPVYLLRELLRDRDDGSQVYADVSALIPKPMPRLVAVDLDKLLANQPGSGLAEYVRELTNQPDLLALLHKAIGESVSGLDQRSYAMRSIRSALGVTE